MADDARADGWNLITPADSQYPSRLLHAHNPPDVLAVRGDAGALAGPAVAVVGSRYPTGYGLRMAHEIAGGLGAVGVVVLSGLARGIDAAAHRAALASGGTTVAVMGTGPDQVYPAEHRSLADEIAGRGALVTEFAPGMPPLAENFPRRNRIIAALADAIVVVEAAKRSGSLITAAIGLALGRPVLAVPGRAGEPKAEGIIDLWRDGAAPACSAAEVLLHLPDGRKPSFLPPEQAGDVVAAQGDPAEALARIGTDVEIHADQLRGALGWPAARLAEALFTLQMGGLVDALPGGFFRRRPGRTARRAV